MSKLVSAFVVLAALVLGGTTAHAVTLLERNNLVQGNLFFTTVLAPSPDPLSFDGAPVVPGVPETLVRLGKNNDDINDFSVLAALGAVDIRDTIDNNTPPLGFFGAGAIDQELTTDQIELVFTKVVSFGPVFDALSTTFYAVITGDFDTEAELFASTSLNISLFSTSPSVAPIPLPASLPLLLGGLAAFGLLRRRARAA